MKRYTILWLDDQHEKMKGFKLQAKQLGIELVCFKSSEALDELEKNYKAYDGVLLDAKFFERENDEAGTESLKALDKANKRILQLPKKFNPFVLTGQAKLFNDDTFNALFPNYYRKANDGDINQLFSDLIREADKQEDTQIKHEHKEVFEIFASGYLPREVAGQVLDLIKRPLPTAKSELIGALTNIRNIHEACLVALKHIGVISSTEDAVSSIIWRLSGSQVKGADGKYVPTTPVYQSRVIENLHKWIYFTCGSYIHSLDEENPYLISNYAVESLRNGILELLLWFKQTYKENS